MTISKMIDVQGGILVAHDGSVNAGHALRSAARLATALKAQVTVVRAWNMSTAPRPDSWAAGYMPPFEDFEAATLAALDHDVSPVRADHPDVDMITVVVRGGPAEKLIEASSSVDMVVVGSRGRGGFAGLLLGSVSEQVVRHAKCPVLVVKSTGAEANRDGGDHEQMERALVSELKLD